MPADSIVSIIYDQSLRFGGQNTTVVSSNRSQRIRSTLPALVASNSTRSLPQASSTRLTRPPSTQSQRTRVTASSTHSSMVRLPSSRGSGNNEPTRNRTGLRPTATPSRPSAQAVRSRPNVPVGQTLRPRPTVPVQASRPRPIFSTQASRPRPTIPAQASRPRPVISTQGPRQRPSVTAHSPSSRVRSQLAGRTPYQARRPSTEAMIARISTQRPSLAVSTQTPRRSRLPEPIHVSSKPSSSSLLPKSKDQVSSSPGLECPVCYEGFKSIRSRGSPLVSTVCGHVFCNKCLTTCMRVDRRCPNCMKETDYEDFHPLYLF